MIITAETLQKMDLCRKHHTQNAIKFVGEVRDISVGNILCALEQGVDVSYFVDYWLREEAGKGLGVGPKGKIPDHLLWIHEELMEELDAINKEDTGPWINREATRQSRRAIAYLRAMEHLWRNKRWAL